MYLVRRRQKVVQVRSHQFGAGLRGRLVVEEGVVNVQDQQLLVLPQIADDVDLVLFDPVGHLGRGPCSKARE